MENLKQKLSERYWKIDEYFNESWEILKKLIKSKWGMALIFFSFFMTLNEDSTFSIIIYSFATIVTVFMLMFSIKRIVKLIEGTELKKRNIFKKTLIIGIITGLIQIIGLGILLFKPLMLMLEDGVTAVPVNVNQTILIPIFYRSIIFYAILFIIYVLYFLFFQNIYLIRNVKFIEAIKYSIHISKGNRMRLLIPIIMLICIITCIDSIVVFGGYFLISILSITGIKILYYYYLISGIMNILNTIITLYMTILSVMIYFNVEYMDFINEKVNIDEAIEKIAEIWDKMVEEEKKAKLETPIETEVVKVEENEIQEIEAPIIEIERFRKTTEEDIEKVMEILEKAKKQIARFGIDQWQDGYPTEGDIRRDIKEGNSYILVDEGEIVGTTAFSFEEEEAYKNLVAGQWITNNERYGVIHRIAVDSEKGKKGYAKELLQNMEEIAKSQNVFSIRTDTHEGNNGMKSYLYKNGFTYCGVCKYSKPEGTFDRMVFEKIIN